MRSGLGSGRFFWITDVYKRNGKERIGGDWRGMIRQTSLMAYKTIRNDLGKKQMDVLLLFRRHRQPLTNKSVARLLGWPINCVTPRVLELRQYGLLIERGVGVENGRKVLYWALA